MEGVEGSVEPITGLGRVRWEENKRHKDIMQHPSAWQQAVLYLPGQCRA